MKKRVLSCILAAAMALALSGCGGSGGGASGAGTSAPAAGSSAAAGSAEGESGTAYDGEVILGSSTWVGYAPPLSG